MDGELKNQVHCKMKRSRSLRYRLLGGLAVALMALISLEMISRLIVAKSANSRFHQINEIVVFLGTQESDLMLDFDAQRFWKLKPNIAISDTNNLFWQGTVSNSLGFRSDEFQLERSPNSLRIVCFGDSSTFGIGSKLVDTWPSQLQTMLSGSLQFNGFDKVEVINAGVPGYSSYQGLQHMRQELKRLQPDVVMASYANNDFWHWDQTTDAQHASKLTESNNLRRVLSYSRLAQLMAVFARHLRLTDVSDSGQPALPNQQWAELATSNYVKPNQEWIRRVPLDAFRENLNQMADLCSASGRPLILVKWPDQPQSLGRWSPRIEYQDVLEDVAANRGLGIADVVSLFQANRNWASHTYIPNDIVHVNRDGNRLAAVAAFESICDALQADEPINSGHKQGQRAVAEVADTVFRLAPSTELF